MIFLVGGLLGLIAGALAGGSVSNLQYVRFRWPLVVAAGLILKEAGVITPLGKLGVAPYFYLASLAVLVAWTLWHHDLLPGIWLIAVGMAMNLLVVAANFGHMPVSRELADHGPPELLQKGVLGQYILAGPDTRLPWLSDWIALPGGIGKIFPQAYSPGDILAFAGMAVVVFFATMGASYQTTLRGALKP
jgi:hypothetical protein